MPGTQQYRSQVRRFRDAIGRLDKARPADRQIAAVLIWAIIEHAVELYCSVEQAGGRSTPLRSRSESWHAYHMRVIRLCCSRQAYRNALRAKKWRERSLYLCMTPPRGLVERLDSELSLVLVELDP